MHSMVGYGGAENVRLLLPQRKRTRGTLSIIVAILAFQAVYFIVTLYLGQYRLEVASAVVLETSVSAEKTAEEQHYKTYLFYDAGTQYHDMNFTCPVPWQWTQDLSSADAAWFNILDHGGAISGGLDYLSLGSLPLRVFMSLESEVYYPAMLTGKSNGFFDYIVDYRIWNGSSGIADIPAVYMMNPLDGGASFRKPPRLPKRNDVYIAAFISNCGSHNNREVYMQELMEHMPMHSYGACQHTIDEPSMNIPRKEKKIVIGSQYHFWFAAENSNAESYVSEKIYEAFDAGVVPVYFGAPNIERFVPDPSSIIVADRYTPKELAALLNKTASNPAEYAKHFEWKKKPFSDDFRRVLRLASRTVQCRLALHLEGLDMEQDW